MEKDVVCGMQVDPAKAQGSSEYQGKTYYFCSPGCKAKFDANPAQLIRCRAIWIHLLRRRFSAYWQRTTTGFALS